MLSLRRERWELCGRPKQLSTTKFDAPSVLRDVASMIRQEALQK